jgi:hypothetical protein
MGELGRTRCEKLWGVSRADAQKTVAGSLGRTLTYNIVDRGQLPLTGLMNRFDISTVMVECTDAANVSADELPH